MDTSLQQQSLIEDKGHVLTSRGVLKLQGCQSEMVFNGMVAGSFPNENQKSSLVYLLDEEGHLQADIFIVEHEQETFLDCDRNTIRRFCQTLEARANEHGGNVIDVSDNWLVMSYLPSQTPLDDGATRIDYVDPRWHMGRRSLRSSKSARSSEWQSELDWTAHVLRLGMIPDVTRLIDKNITTEEASLHALIGHGLPSENTEKRILPVRVEPSAQCFPTMTEALITAGNREIGTVLQHQGLYAIAMVDLPSWRGATRQGLVHFCEDQQVLVTWPTWSAVESNGRGGPVAQGR